jgi:ribosomal protein L11 methyltransferase
MDMVNLQPTDKLYIFEIDGVIDENYMEFPDDFLGGWVEGDYTYMFFTADHEEDVEKFLTRRKESLRSKTVMDYSDWEAGRKLKHLRVGRILVCPTWDVVEPGPGEVRLVLEPGVAFGTGWHQTTNSSLELLQRVFEKDPPKNVLDLGTGTGILSIASALLGAEKVVGVDYNQLSLSNAKLNVRINEVEDRVQLVYGDALDHIGRGADLLTANLYFDAISKLLNTAELMRIPRIIFSGLLTEFVPAFTEKIGTVGLKVVDELAKYEWYSCIVEPVEK